MKLILALVAVSACTSSDPSPREVLGPPQQHVAIPEHPNFTLYVSNQSFDIPTIDIEIQIDGQLVITGDFAVEGQHSWFPFLFDLAPGAAHTVEVTANGGATQIVDTALIGDAYDYAIVSFWSADETSVTPHVDYLFLDDEPAFQ